MRREIVVPNRHPRKAEDRTAHRRDELRLIEQKQRHGRIADVDRRGAAVGVVLFGDKQQLAVFVRDQLVRGNRLPIGGGYDLRIVLAADAARVAQQLAVELFAAPEDLVLACAELVQRRGDRLAVSCPIAGQQAAEIIDRRNLVVADEQRERTRLIRDLAAAQHARIGFGGIVDHGVFLARRKKDVAGVVRHVIARALERRLDHLSHIADVQRLRLKEVLPHRRHTLAGAADRAECVENDLDVMLFAVEEFHRILNVGNRRGENIQVVEQQRRGEAYRQPNAADLKDVLRRKRRDLTVGQNGGDLRVSAEVAIDRSVDDEHADQLLRRVAPMDGIIGGGMIRRRPDGKVGIVRDQRDGGKPCHLFHKDASLSE